MHIGTRIADVCPGEAPALFVQELIDDAISFLQLPV